MNPTTIDVRGCKLHVRRSGRGEPLLFLHGAQGLSDREPGLDALAREFDVIAPDHPGFGRSESSELIDDVGDLAFFYLDLIDALGLDQVHVVGQCIGGWVALEMAVRSTEQLKSLVLVNSAGILVKGVPRADMFICSQDELQKLLFANGAADWRRRSSKTSTTATAQRQPGFAGRRGCATPSSNAGCTASTCRPTSSGAARTG
jgi:pimeloyl-ACP methyl ester carboxylesterase